jgi:D-alanyl-D-alanine carboxypeptidase
MKFLIFVCLTISAIASAITACAAEKGCSSSYSSLILEEESGKILSETRSDEIAYPASLVKVMTLYLTFEALEKHKLAMNQKLTISERGEEIARVNKSNSAHLRAGDKITVKEAIQGVIVKSFNESAVTLAEAVAGDEWNFARQMNEKAAELGMINTSFRNASGLHDEGQYTTSYDLARLAVAIKKNFPQYYHLFALKEFKYRGTKYKTHNHVLLDYKGAEGMKTGFTRASGFNLITSAKKRDKHLISILLGCASYQSRDRMTKELLNKSFQKLSKPHSTSVEVKLSRVFDYKSRNELENYDGEEVRFGEICEPLPQ